MTCAELDCGYKASENRRRPYGTRRRPERDTRKPLVFCPECMNLMVETDDTDYSRYDEPNPAMVLMCSRCGHQGPLI
jgi:hypothetical protein